MSNAQYVCKINLSTSINILLLRKLINNIMSHTCVRILKVVVRDETVWASPETIVLVDIFSNIL